MRNKRIFFDQSQKLSLNTQHLLSFESFSNEQEENEDFLYLKEKLAQFNEKKKVKGCGMGNSSFIKKVFRNLSFLLNEINLTKDKAARVDKIDKTKKWFLRKVGMGQVEGKEMCESGKVMGKKEEWGGGVRDVEGRGRYLFRPFMVFGIKGGSREMIRFSGNRKKHRDWISFSPELGEFEHGLGVSDYYSGRSLNTKTIEKLSLKPSTYYKPPSLTKKDSTKALKLSSELILKSRTVQESAKKCFEYSRRIFRK